jgi:hypothetical protein
MEMQDAHERIIMTDTRVVEADERVAEARLYAQLVESMVHWHGLMINARRVAEMPLGPLMTEYEIAEASAYTEVARAEAYTRAGVLSITQYCMYRKGD